MDHGKRLSWASLMCFFRPTLVARLRRFFLAWSQYCLSHSLSQAQAAIAEEVSERFLLYINHGDTQGAVNFPQLAPRVVPSAHRILNIHRCALHLLHTAH